MIHRAPLQKTEALEALHAYGAVRRMVTDDEAGTVDWMVVDAVKLRQVLRAGVRVLNPQPVLRRRDCPKEVWCIWEIWDYLDEEQFAVQVQHRTQNLYHYIHSSHLHLLLYTFRGGTMM